MFKNFSMLWRRKPKDKGKHSLDIHHVRTFLELNFRYFVHVYICSQQYFQHVSNKYNVKGNRGFSIKSKPSEWMGNIKPNISMYITKPQEKWGNFLEKYTLVFQFVLFEYFISVMVLSLEDGYNFSSPLLRFNRWDGFSWSSKSN